jgi:hypothetical protein
LGYRWGRIDFSAGTARRSTGTHSLTQFGNAVTPCTDEQKRKYVNETGGGADRHFEPKTAGGLQML